MKSTLFMATFFCVLGLSACGNEDFSGDYNVTRSDSNGQVNCEDACRYAGFWCSKDEYDYPCRNSQDLTNKCLDICTSRNSSVIFNLINEYDCNATATFIGVECKYRNKDAGVNNEDDEEDEDYK